MKSQELGAKFEKVTRDFFVWLFEEIGFTVIKDRLQFSGTQDGFDVQIIITLDGFEKSIFIECKNYSKDLDVGNIYKKAFDLEKNYNLTENDLFIAILPKSNFKNADNSEKTAPILNEKFKFKSYMLDVSTGIKELFAINSDFYNEIYESEIDFPVDVKNQINKFKNIIFSRKPFAKVFLNEKDKIDFIGRIEPNKNYINRLLNDNFISKDQEYKFFNNLTRKQFSTLDTILQNQNKVLILGNPGLGKSTELKEFALSKWKIGEQRDPAPIYRNLKNFTTTNNIEDFLPNRFKDLVNCFIIFDGVDEIKDCQDFISKLENFIENSDTKQRTYKFLLSCRTNIYESIVKQINGFKVYYLTNLLSDEAFSLLNKQLNNPTLVEKLSFKIIHYDFLKNPFLIEILSDYINTTSKLPHNSIELWENYINKRLEFDNKNKLLKLKLNTPLIIKFSKRISIMCELMKVNSITEIEMFELIRDNKEEYLKSPLIEKDLFNNSWNFEHRNIQEYFASKYLSELSYENIINFINISGNAKQEYILFQKIKKFLGIGTFQINKTHPSLFNTITFLTNIIEDKKREQIIKWLETNEPEILFTADNDRLSLEIKKNVFQNYFKKTCIEKTFWISHNRNFNAEVIGKFGDCEDNFNYLLSFIQNSDTHFRVIISALDLLNHMSLLTKNYDEVKSLFLSKLKSSNIEYTNSKENDLKVKSHIITCIIKFKFHQQDSEYLTEILEYFKNEDNEEISYSLLTLVKSLNQGIDNHFEFILKEFLRIFKVEKQSKKSKNVSNKLAIEDAVYKLNNPDNFLKIMHYFLNVDNNYNISFENSFILKMFDKSKSMALLHNTFIDKLLVLINKRKNWHDYQNEIVEFILSTNSQDRAIQKFIYDDISLKESKYLVARLISHKNLNLIIDNFIDKKSANEDIVIFRNILGNTNSPDLAISFEQIMSKGKYIFNENFPSQKDLEILNKKRISIKQKNFDILFNKENIIFELGKIYKEINKDPLNWDIICDYEKCWYDKNGHSIEIDSAITLLRNIINDDGEITQLEIIEQIDDEKTLMFEIRRYLERNKELNVSEEQKDKIQSWCLKSIEDINYDQIISVINNSIFLDYFKFKNIYRFQKIFDFKIPQAFFLDTLRYCDYESYNNENSQFEFSMTQISNKEIFDKVVVENINKHQLHSTALKNHISYAIENNLTMSFEKIKKYILNSTSLYYRNENLLNLYLNTKDLEFLKRCSNSSYQGLAWESIKIITKYDLDKGYVVDKAKQYLLLQENDYRMEALGLLFKYNEGNAFEIFFDFVKKELGESVKQEYYSNYNNEIGFKFVKEFYYLLYKKSTNDDVFKHHDTKKLYSNYINNLSIKNEHSFKKIQRLLFKIKEKEQQNKEELFYINLLIEESTQSYINSKSTPLSFDEAKLKVESY